MLTPNETEALYWKQNSQSLINILHFFVSTYLTIVHYPTPKIARTIINIIKPINQAPLPPLPELPLFPELGFIQFL